MKTDLIRSLTVQIQPSCWRQQNGDAGAGSQRKARDRSMIGTRATQDGQPTDSVVKESLTTAAYGKPKRPKP